jgi:hypothetical protein
MLSDFCSAVVSAAGVGVKGQEAFLCPGHLVAGREGRALWELPPISLCPTFLFPLLAEFSLLKRQPLFFTFALITHLFSI